MKQIKIRITLDGKAKEINQEQGMSYRVNKLSIPSRKVLDKYCKWANAEIKLRIFDIKYVVVNGEQVEVCRNFDSQKELDIFLEAYSVNSIHTAEIIDINKLIVRIL